MTEEVTDYGYENLGTAIVRQACNDFDEASRLLTQFSSFTLMMRIERGKKKTPDGRGILSNKEARRLYRENRARMMLRECEQFFHSPWCRECIGGNDGVRFLEALKYRDWWRQCTRDGHYIPRGDEYIEKSDMTDKEKRLLRCTYGYEHVRNDEEIRKWYDSLSDKDKSAMRRTRSYDESAVYKVLGVRL